MIIDSFPFFNEYQLCDVRLNYYAKTVDAFVITESNLTWRCQPNFRKFDRVYKNLDSSIRKKIHYEFLEYSDEYIGSLDHSNRKTIQNLSRDKLLDIAKRISVGEYTIFFYSDLDEFWDARDLLLIKQKLDFYDYIVCNQDMRMVKLEWFARQRNWPGTRIAYLKNLKESNCLSTGIFKYSKSGAFKRLHSFPSGWHFTYFGTDTQRTDKLSGIKDAEDWESRKNKTYSDIAKSVGNIDQWNAVARKKKMNVRYNLSGHIIDPILQKHLSKYPIFFETKEKK